MATPPTSMMQTLDMASQQTPIRVCIVNDYEVVVRGLASMLAPFDGRVTVVETEAGGLPDRSADVVLFDTFAERRRSLSRLDDMAGDDALSKIVLYTWDLPREFARDVDMRSIDGVILKSTVGEDLVDAIERVHRGERVMPVHPEDETLDDALTYREREVLALLALGAKNREIANELYLSLDTIKTHVRNVFTKLGVSNRTQAAIVAHEYGLDAPRSNEQGRAS